ncbi:hypothetical protein [Natronoglomus mannanivorans]|uniref:Uncharacterized protein n=1 Tax=Natronoglomus mannanivorans TaxID=2979990 RepID=A0AAP2YWB7_9EURY|nr:hypothetical protein [Halobacteria archaeon AArc-xg1-1]
MNRRTLLRAGIPLSVVALSGCLSSIQDLRLSTPVVIEIENEMENNQNVVITAHALADDRQTYDEAVSVSPDQTTTVGRLSDEDQHVRTALVDSDGNELDVEETFVGERTQSLGIVIIDGGIELDVREREPSE